MYYFNLDIIANKNLQLSTLVKGIQNGGCLGLKWHSQSKFLGKTQRTRKFEMVLLAFLLFPIIATKVFHIGNGWKQRSILNLNYFIR